MSAPKPDSQGERPAGTLPDGGDHPVDGGQPDADAAATTTVDSDLRPRGPGGLLLPDRQSLPEDLKFLLHQFPRGTWRRHVNIRGMATMWLQRHAMFRELGGLLAETVQGHRDGRIGAYEFAQEFVPRLQFFLSELEGHHSVEDNYYFPTFVRAEPRLAPGFEILDRDHHQIHEALERNAKAANIFIQSLKKDPDSRRFAAESYADENAMLVAMLTRHLDDEEDLIIPLILDHGDRKLGIV